MKAKNKANKKISKSELETVVEVRPKIVKTELDKKLKETGLFQKGVTTKVVGGGIRVFCSEVLPERERSLLYRIMRDNNIK